MIRSGRDPVLKLHVLAHDVELVRCEFRVGVYREIIGRGLFFAVFVNVFDRLFRLSRLNLRIFVACSAQCFNLDCALLVCARLRRHIRGNVHRAVPNTGVVDYVNSFPPAACGHGTALDGELRRNGDVNAAAGISAGGGVHGAASNGKLTHADYADCHRYAENVQRAAVNDVIALTEIHADVIALDAQRARAVGLPVNGQAAADADTRNRLLHGERCAIAENELRVAVHADFACDGNVLIHHVPAVCPV